MLERVDGARASSVVIFLVAMVLVAGVLVEAARIETAGPRLARRLAGAVFVCYGILGTGYLLVRERSAAGS